jgi:DNA-binding response OmpR family regulator
MNAYSDRAISRVFQSRSGNTMTRSNEPSLGSADDHLAPDSAAHGVSRSGKRILIVDDDFEIVEAVRYALEGAGHEVVVARDGNQGLALAERESPDLMILDMMMPKRSGFLVLEKLRRMRDDSLPVIMITGNEGSRHKAYAELLGVSDYIRKPFAMDRLLEAVHKLLGS